MDPSFDSFPEEFADALMNDFAYDPIRLPLSEDPAQVLYNRRTLEKIWDNKQIALNPYTRQPFNIHNVIPQTELKRQMRQYIIENNRHNDLLVIDADYTETVSSADMQCLLNRLVEASEKCLRENEIINGMETEPSWKVLWRVLNLIRLYCQCKAENRDVFLSLKGYKYLLNAINPKLYSLTLYSSILNEDAGEACKEVAKIINVVGLKDSDLQGIPPENISPLLQILADLVYKKDLQIESMVLRIYVRMYEDCNEYVVRGCAKTFNILSFHVAIHLLLRRRNNRDITNEDLFNVTALLNAAWIRHHGLNLRRYVDALVKVVILCISRFNDLDLASIHRLEAAEDQATLSNSGREDHINEEEEKNIHMISRALDRGLFLINCIVTHDLEKYPFVLQWIERLLTLDIVKDIVRMLKHVLDGCKFYQSSHLQFGLNITALLCREEQGIISENTRNSVVEVSRDFIESDFVNEYDPQIKLLLQDVVVLCRVP